MYQILTLELNKKSIVRVHDERNSQFVKHEAQELKVNQAVKISTARKGDRFYVVSGIQLLESTVLLQLKVLPEMRNNIDILATIEKSREFFKVSERLRFKTPVTQIEMPIYGQDRVATSIVRKTFTGDRVTCSCCGTDIHKGEYALHVEFYAAEMFVGGKNKAEEFKKLRKVFHYHSCMTEYQRWKVVSHKDGIRFIDAKAASDLNHDAYTLACDIQSAWLAFSADNKYFEFAADIPSLLRAYDRMRERGHPITKVCRVCPTTLNGEYPMSLTQVEDYLGLELLDYQRMEKEAGSDTSYVLVSFDEVQHVRTQETYAFQYCNSLEDARKQFVECRQKDDCICYGFIKMQDVKDVLSSCNARRV